ncbi:MAG TPA: coenzyme F420-0:L-glutamate ligase [Candidatus Paceibacterota bacterium]
MLVPNKGKNLEISIDGVSYLRLPIKTRLINPSDDLMKLLEEYVRPHIQTDDLLFVSEKVVCICQSRVLPIKDIRVSHLARFLAKQINNKRGTPEFRGFGHSTAFAMQLFLEEAGYLRILFAAFVSAITRPFGIKGAFYFISGKMAKSVDCPMSFSFMPYLLYAKRAPLNPNKVAREIHDKFGIETVIVDANYRGAFSLGKSTSAISEKFIQALVRDNPAGQDNEMTPFFLVRKT